MTLAALFYAKHPRRTDARRRRPKRRRAPVFFETLERRLLLSSDLAIAPILALDPTTSTDQAMVVETIPSSESGAVVAASPAGGSPQPAASQPAAPPPGSFDPQLSQTQDFTVNTVRDILVRPFDPALGRLDKVHVMIDGNLRVDALAVDHGVPSLYQLDVTQDFTGIDKKFFDLDPA